MPSPSIALEQGRLAAEAEAHGRNILDLQRFLEGVCASEGIQPTQRERRRLPLAALLAQLSRCPCMRAVRPAAADLPCSPSTLLPPAATPEAAAVAFLTRLGEVEKQLESTRALDRQADVNLGRSVDQVGVWCVVVGGEDLGTWALLPAVAARPRRQRLPSPHSPSTLPSSHQPLPLPLPITRGR